MPASTVRCRPLFDTFSSCTICSQTANKQRAHTHTECVRRPIEIEKQQQQFRSEALKLKWLNEMRNVNETASFGLPTHKNNVVFCIVLHFPFYFVSFLWLFCCLVGAADAAAADAAASVLSFRCPNRRITKKNKLFRIHLQLFLYDACAKMELFMS